MAWYSVKNKAQGQLYLNFFIYSVLKNRVDSSVNFHLTFDCILDGCSPWLQNTLK